MKFLWILPLIFLFGCADSGTQGDSNMREYSRLVAIDNNTGTITIEVYLSAASDMDTETTQDTSNQASVSPRTSAALYGGTAGMASDGAEFMMEGIESLWQQWQDNRKEDSDNSVTPAPVVKPDTPVIEPGDGYETYFHHTMWDPDKKADGGKSLVLCPGQPAFEKCTANIVEIPLRDGLDDGRISYWLQDKAPVGDIVCKDSSGKEYRFKSDELQVNGNCD